MLVVTGTRDSPPDRTTDPGGSGGPRRGRRLMPLTLASLMASVSMTPEAAAGSAATTAVATPLEQVGWLSGRWVDAASPPATEEDWGRALANTMYGVGRSFAVDDAGAHQTVFYEVLRIRTAPGEGCGLVYTAWPGGGPATDFVCESLGAASAVFANPAHDFPQRISYRRDGDVLHIEISGAAAGAEVGADQKRVAWTLQRAGD